MTETIEELLQDCWNSIGSGTAPDLLLIDQQTGEMIRVMNEATKRFREITSPLGLKRLFPGLK